MPAARLAEVFLTPPRSPSFVVLPTIGLLAGWLFRRFAPALEKPPFGFTLLDESFQFGRHIQIVRHCGDLSIGIESSRPAERARYY